MQAMAIVVTECVNQSSFNQARPVARVLCLNTDSMQALKTTWGAIRRDEGWETLMFSVLVAVVKWEKTEGRVPVDVMNCSRTKFIA